MKLELLCLSSVLAVSSVSAASIAKRQAELSEECSFVGSKYFITPSRVSGDTAASYCRSLGGKLADVTQQNSIDMNAIVAKCLGPNKSVRIQTWDTNNFGTNHLAMKNGFEASAGSVNIAEESEELYALCQMAEGDEAELASENKIEETAAEVDADVTDSDLQVDAETAEAEAVDAQPEAEADAEPEVDAQAEADVQPEADAQADAQADAEAEVDTEPEADAEAEVDTEPEVAEVEADAQPEAVEVAEAQPEVAEAEAQPEVVEAETEAEEGSVAAAGLLDNTPLVNTELNVEDINAPIEVLPIN